MGLDSDITASIQSSLSEMHTEAGTTPDDAPIDGTTEVVEEVAPLVEGTTTPDEGVVKPEDAAAVAAAAALKPVVNPDDEFDFDKLPEKDATGRTNRIPHPRVKKMVETSVKRAEAKWETEKLAPERAKVTTYETRLQDVAKVEHVMFNEPARMVEILRTIPGYEKVLPAAGAAVPAAEVVSTAGPRPEPDGMLPDGVTPGYTPAGLQKLLDWNTAVATEKAVAAVEAKFGGRIKPFEDAREASARVAEQSRAIAADLNKAAKWDGFVDNAEAILDVFRADQNLSLLDAYHKVVLPKFKGDANTMRQQLMDEIAKAPRSTAAGGAAAVSRPGQVPAVSDDPIGDSIRADIKKKLRNV